jgi:DNA invertase Pin-like site-specific DNA recombinase
MKDTLHIYTRVSTSNQVGNTSIDEQKDNGIELSKKIKMNYEIHNEGHGSGFSEFSEFRPIFRQLLENIKDGKIKHLFVKDLSRLTRNEMDSYKISQILLEYDVTLYTTDGKFDLESDDRRMMYKILTMFNEYQVRISRMKSIEGKVRRVHEGKYMLTIPFGYIKEDGYLKKHPENGEWVRKMFEWYNGGMSSVDIRKEFFKNDVKPIRSESGWFPPRTIQVMLRNDTYIGNYTFHDKESGVTIKPNPSNVPPLVDKKLFYDVQKRMDMEGHNSNQKIDYLLRDVISCPCGTPMNCKGGKKDLYICRNQERTYQKRKSVCDDCVPMRSVKMSYMDDYVWNTLLHTLSQSSLIKESVKKEILGKKSTYGKRTIKNSLKKLNEERSNLDSMRLELEKDYYSGKMDKNRFDVLIQSVNQRENDLNTEITTKQVELDSINKKDKWLNWIEVHLTNVNELNKITDIKERQKIIKEYVETVGLRWDEKSKQHTLNINFKLPLVDDSISYKKGKSNQFLRDRKGFKKYEILEGEKELTTPNYLPNSFNSYTFC